MSKSGENGAFGGDRRAGTSRYVERGNGGLRWVPVPLESAGFHVVIPRGTKEITGLAS